MKWEVSEWRGPNTEDGAAILNAKQQQWRISLSKHQRQEGPLERCGGGGSCASAGQCTMLSPMSIDISEVFKCKH